MRKVFAIMVICFLSIHTYSQEHIKFNGATFGLPLNEFIEGFPEKPRELTSSYPPKGYNSDLCNYNPFEITLNSKKWGCRIFSSRISNTVFRTVCSYSAWRDNLKNDLMLLVKTLEGKYGDGVQEKQEDLGEIVHYTTYRKEMLALYYYVKNSNNKVIGEIRISAAPSDKDAKNGLIELSYTDYKAHERATKEYNSIMNDAL